MANITNDTKIDIITVLNPASSINNNTDWLLLQRGSQSLKVNRNTFFSGSFIIDGGNISPNSILLDSIKHQPGRSVIGRSGSGEGKVDHIEAGTNTVLRRTTGNLEFGQITSNMITAGTIALDRITSIGGNSIIGNPTASDDSPQVIAAEENNTVLARSNNSLEFQKVTGSMIANSTVTSANLATALGGDYIRLEDRKPSGTNGGSLTGNTWNVRTINTEVNDSGNHCEILPGFKSFKLQAGTYRFKIECPAFATNKTRVRLRPISHNIEGDMMMDGAIYGPTIMVTVHSNDAVATAIIPVNGEFTIDEEVTFQIEQYSQVTGANRGGLASNLGVNEIYTVAEFWKIA